MDYASRKAQRIANNFMDDLDSMSRASRVADRRAMSHFETPIVTVRREPSVTRTVRYSTRLGSVPPPEITQTRVSYVTSESPSVYQTPIITTRRHRRALSINNSLPRTYTSTALPPVNQTSTVYPSRYRVAKVATPPVYNSAVPRYSGYVSDRSVSNLASERRRLNRKLDDVMDFKFPSADYYTTLRKSLTSLNQKMDSHRQLLDRYSGIDMTPRDDSVSDRIDRKFAELRARGVVTH